MVCSDKTQFACDNLCGNPLPCGNHYCSFTCHPLEIRSSSLDKRSESCEKCELRCQKVLLLLCVKSSLWSQLVRGKDFSLSFIYTGEITTMPTYLSSALPSRRLSTLQNSSKEIMSLWRDGPCIRVHWVQYIVWEGPIKGPLMPWTLSQVTN